MSHPALGPTSDSVIVVYQGDILTGGQAPLAEQVAVVYTNTGLQGPPGWVSGDGVPSDTVGADGTLYVDKQTGNVYLKDAGVWDIIGSFAGSSPESIRDIVGAMFANTATIAFDYDDNADQITATALIDIADVTGLQLVLDAKAAEAHTHILGDVTGLQAALDAKSNVGHGHAISDSTGLQSALDAKSDDGHGHTVGDVPGLQDSLDGKASTSHGHAVGDTTGLQGILDAKSDVGHGHSVSDTTGLQAALDAKSDDGHGHAVGDVTGLQSELDGKAATAHGHAVSDTTGLQVALDGKSDDGHGHSISDTIGLQEALDSVGTEHDHTIVDTTGLQAALDAKVDDGDPRLTDARTPTAHSHPISDTTGLQTALDGKSDEGHGHAIADTTGLQGALDGKAPTVHTHAISAVTGLQAILDGKAESVHGHAIGDTAGLQAALDSKAATTHGHAVGDVTGLQGALDGKVDDSDPRLTDARTPTAHGHAISDTTGLQTALDGKALDSAVVHKTGDETVGGIKTFTSPPKSVAAVAADDLITKGGAEAAITAAIDALVAGAPGALDTLNELAAALGDDAAFSATVTTALSEKLVKSANLSDLADAATARTNLGLGTAAQEDASAFDPVGTAASAVAALSATLDNVATSGAYSDLSGTPTLGTAASKNVGTTAGDVAAGDAPAAAQAAAEATAQAALDAHIDETVDAHDASAVSTNLAGFNKNMSGIINVQQALEIVDDFVLGSNEGFALFGAAEVKTYSDVRRYIFSQRTFGRVLISAGTAPTSTNLVCQLLKNGSPFGTPVTLLAGNYYTSSTQTLTAVAGDYIQVSFTSVGSPAAANLTIVLEAA
jgi:hypothetical protein